MRLWGSIRLHDEESWNPISLGRHAVYGSLGTTGAATEYESVMLVRDGVMLLDLGPTLREQGLNPASLVGWIDCPTLRLTADERSVARDTNFEQLVAWLHDYAARADGMGVLRWPDSLGEGPQLANGRTITLEQLREDATRGRELVYVWRHQAAAVPAAGKARIAALWPSEELLLRQQFPTLRLVPLRALGQQDIDPADLTSLAGGSHEPLALARDEPFASPHAEGGCDSHSTPTSTALVRLRSATSRSSRTSAASRNSTSVHSWSPASRWSAASTPTDTSSTSPRCAAITRAWPRSRISAAASPRSTARPCSRTCCATPTPGRTRSYARGSTEIGPGTIELRYQKTDDGVRLGWSDSMLLGVTVGRTREGQAKTLRDGLRSLRERGFVIVGHPLKRHDQTRSADPQLQPWLLDDAGRALLVRLLGGASVLDMPVVAEAHPLVVADPVEDQRHLIRQRETIMAGVIVPPPIHSHASVCSGTCSSRAAAAVRTRRVSRPRHCSSATIHARSVPRAWSASPTRSPKIRGPG